MSAPGSLGRHLVRPLLVAAGAALLPAPLVACGASARALYESDVRFEHCMALDAAPETKPTLQRTCWEEWTSFYTYGQTRDRIDYARERKKELGSASDFDEGEPFHETAGVSPDPTSAIAPPPSMISTVDGGATAAATNAEDEKVAARARCGTECDDRREACGALCKHTAACEQICAVRHKRCTLRCDRPAQGSR
jgi:hypothetical protein